MSGVKLHGSNMFVLSLRSETSQRIMYSAHTLLHLACISTVALMQISVLILAPYFLAPIHIAMQSSYTAKKHDSMCACQERSKTNS